MGFCLFNNIARRRAARAPTGLERVAIVDWDVHHGNGTQDVFCEDPTVLTISLHQDGLYPADTGTLEQTGNGRGGERQRPAAAWTRRRAATARVRAVVAPALRRFAPDLLIVGSGQDASATDPLGACRVNVEGFRASRARGPSPPRSATAAWSWRTRAATRSMHLPLWTLAILEGLAGLELYFPVDPIGSDVPPGAARRGARRRRGRGGDPLWA